MEIKEINPQAAGSVHWKFWYLWSNRCLLLAWRWSTPLNWHIIPFLLPIFFFFSLLLDWKGRDNLGLERAVRPGTLLIHLHTGQACWGQPLLDIFAIMAKICRTEMFTCKKKKRWKVLIEVRLLTEWSMKYERRYFCHSYNDLVLLSQVTVTHYRSIPTALPSNILIVICFSGCSTFNDT